MPLPRPAADFSFHSEVGWEETLSQAISRINSERRFHEVYHHWLDRHPTVFSEAQRYNWLKCILYYVTLPGAASGESNWTAIIDEQPSQTLFPTRLNLPDLQTGIPESLRVRPELVQLQNRLFKRHGIIALDHTDQHASGILRSLLLLLDHAFVPGFSQQLPSFKFLYAFSGHDDQIDRGAFHQKAHAISVGGRLSYPEINLPGLRKIRILSTLAHEIGHAFLFDVLTPRELREITRRFLDWQLPEGATQEDFFSEIFLQPFPEMLARHPRASLVSEYATTNVHEWFAEAFSAAALNRLARQGWLAGDWQRQLARDAQARAEGWVSERTLDPQIQKWMDAKVRFESAVQPPIAQ